MLPLGTKSHIQSWQHIVQRGDILMKTMLNTILWISNIIEKMGLDLDSWNRNASEWNKTFSSSEVEMGDEMLYRHLTKI